MSIPPSAAPVREHERLAELDALRGLAAFVVVLGHLLVVLDMRPETMPPWLATLADATPLYFLRATHESVILFFVLSGLVLALPYCDGKRQPYSAFLTKRVFRIYVPTSPRSRWPSWATRRAAGGAPGYRRGTSTIGGTTSSAGGSWGSTSC